MPLSLKPGERVRVRSAQEILSTLDQYGTLEELPFMPEMLRHCGRTFQVSKSAFKTCDGAANMRRMKDTVHLEDLRCDGSAHGGCQAGCLTYWKEAWLERVAESLEQPEAMTAGQASAAEALAPTTRRPPDPDGEPVFRCQATQVVDASTALGWSDLRQYKADVENWGAGKLMRGIAVSLFNKVQATSQRRLPPRLRLRGGDRYPFFRGRLAGPPPRATLGLQPGDLVRIKSREAIAATVTDTDPPKLRGLSFDVEMLKYCGRTARVRARVNRIINERTGKMISIESDCIMLDGVVCVADYHRFCSRSVYVYWREAWLERVG
jgi:hypothetical protein